MTESITVARPYAKAVFAFAKEKGSLQEWSERLAYLVVVVKDKLASAYLKNATQSAANKVDFLVNLNPSMQGAKTFLEALAQFDRLMLLPEVAAHFEEAKAEFERVLEVQVLVSNEMSKEQQQKLEAALKKRFQKEVALSVKIDPQIIGGLMIQVEDLVIDYSVQGRLQELAKELIA